MSDKNNNFAQSVTAVVIRNGKVLLSRHTYGGGKGKLIVPGGYVMNGEAPKEAVKREFLEETNVEIRPLEIIGVRFNTRDWYIAFRGEYISGEAKSDNNENSEVLWLDVTNALSREDVPDLTKKLIRCALSKSQGLVPTEYDGKNPPFSLYGLE